MIKKSVENNPIFVGDVLEVLQTLPDNSVHCCVTSPPYWGLRDYGIENQLGMENTPEEYIQKLVEIFREVKRVLREDGTFWLNLGDSYWCGKGQNGSSKSRANATERGYKQSRGTVVSEMRPQDGKHQTIKPKDLVGIPWKVAFALQADGWYLRQDIIWEKPNPMPESVRDRCTKAHEYIFLLTKSAKYFYDNDAIKEPLSESTMKIHSSKNVRKTGKSKWKMLINKDRGENNHDLGLVNGTERLERMMAAGGRNKRSVWKVTTKPFRGAHFAVFPPDLIKPCILAGTSEKGCCPDCGAPWERVVETIRKENREKIECGNKNENGVTRPTAGLSVPAEYKMKITRTVNWKPTCHCLIYLREYDALGEQIVIPPSPIPCIVLDPFIGSGTTGMVALQNGRKFIGIDLNEEYVDMAIRRIEGDGKKASFGK